MSGHPGPLYTRRGLDQIRTDDAAICPKCRGRGAIPLMHRTAGLADFDVCPACRGSGLVSKRNGYSDPTPATIRGRS